MKKIAFLLLAFAPFSVLSLGCNTGPGEASVEESKESMDESMAIDTMGEAEATADTPAEGGADTAAP